MLGWYAYGSCVRYMGCENDNINSNVNTPSEFKGIGNFCTWSILNACNCSHVSVSSLDKCAKYGVPIHHMCQAAWEGSNNIECGIMKRCPWCDDKAKSK